MTGVSQSLLSNLVGISKPHPKKSMNIHVKTERQLSFQEPGTCIAMRRFQQACGKVDQMRLGWECLQNSTASRVPTSLLHILRIHKTRMLKSLSPSHRHRIIFHPVPIGPDCIAAPGRLSTFSCTDSGPWWSRSLLVSTRECSCSSPHLTCLCCVCMIDLTNNRTQSTTCTCPITSSSYLFLLFFSLPVAQTVFLFS